MRGRVKWFNNKKGYGFIEDKELGDIFIHYSNIEKSGYKTLTENQEVEFEAIKTEKGYQAIHIRTIEDLQATK